MDITWGNAIDYLPDYWPYWLMLCAMLLAAVLGALAIHGLLRYMLSPRIEGGHEHRTYLYSRGIRFWHWCNAMLFILLLFSGIVNHFSIGPTPELVGLHKICGIVLLIFWIFYILLNLFGGNGHHYRVRFQGWIGRCFKQVRFYLYGIMKGEPHPFPATQECKFNPIQQVAYLGIMFGLMPLLLITGFACLYPEVFGYAYWTFKAHQVLAVIGLLFLFVHIYLCTTGDTPVQTFKSMINGYHHHIERGH